MIDQRCINCGKKVEWIILGINLGLFFVKGSFALISHSKSLLTDSFQSLANFIITLVVIASIRLAARGADKKFPYGYGKVEFLASGRDAGQERRTRHGPRDVVPVTRDDIGVHVFVWRAAVATCQG